MKHIVRILYALGIAKKEGKSPQSNPTLPESKKKYADDEIANFDYVYIPDNLIKH